MCFIELLYCVIGIANGPVGLVILYEKDVQARVIELGLSSKEKIRKSLVFTALTLLVPFLLLPPIMVYGINGAGGFRSGFMQLTSILWIAGLFDIVFIDWYWVGKTKAWIIPGTEDLMPYIPKKVFIRKLLGKIAGYPVIAAVMAGIIQLIQGI